MQIKLAGCYVFGGYSKNSNSEVMVGDIDFYYRICCVANFLYNNFFSTQNCRKISKKQDKSDTVMLKNNESGSKADFSVTVRVRHISYWKYLVEQFCLYTKMFYEVS